MRSRLHSLLKPRTPDDCPACRLASTASSVVEPAPTLVRPWSEVKSRRGAPKRIHTSGFACPNHQCSYFGITDTSIQALVGDGKHGRAEQIQTFRCQACRATFTCRCNTALYRLKTPSQQVAVVLAAQRYRQQTPAMAPGRTNRVWMAREVLSCPLHRFPLESDDYQVRVQCHVVEWLGKVQAGEVRWGLTSG